MASLKTATAQDRALEEEAKIELSYHSAVCHITARDSHLRASAVSQDVGTLGSPNMSPLVPCPGGGVDSVVSQEGTMSPPPPVQVKNKNIPGALLESAAMVVSY